MSSDVEHIFVGSLFFCISSKSYVHCLLGIFSPSHYPIDPALIVESVILSA